MPPFCGNNTLQQILNLISAKLTVLAAKEVDLSPILEAIAAIPETDLTAVLSALATINGVQTSVNSANSSLGTITTNTGLANSKLDTLQDDVTIIKTNANTINTNVNTANGTLNNHTTTLTTITTNTGSALTKLDTIQAAIDALSGVGGTTTVKAAIVWDEKAQGASGGTFASGAWRQRDLNMKNDPDSLLSVASNQITMLSSGNYLIKAACPASYVNQHQARLLKNSTPIAVGQIIYTWDTDHETGISHVSWVGAITAGDVIKLEHRCQTTKTNGFGFAAGNDWGNVVFSIVEIIKLD